MENIIELNDSRIITDVLNKAFMTVGDTRRPEEKYGLSVLSIRYLRSENHDNDSN